MNSIYFCNIEPIDLNAIAIMGVSVKIGNNPIGYFGTGLKFSIATLLRTGHEITLIRDGVEIVFSARHEIVRGETFDRIYMGDEALSFTTQLGRNWEPWQAYRELRCNTIDENGIVSTTLPPSEWGTIFIIKGEAISQCHRNRRQIFLESTPITATNDCEIHAGENGHAFYRGVRAHSFQGNSIFTYNILEQTDLTEDRTIKNVWEIGYYAERAIAASDNVDVIESAILAPRGTFEAALSYSNSSRPSPAFMAAAFHQRQNAHANQRAIKLWEKFADIKLTFTEAVLDEFDEEQIAKALPLCHRLGAEVMRQDFMVVNDLGSSVYGTVRSNKILIARATLDMGVRFIASTVYEEWLHKTQSLKDETRELQNLLFEKLFAMTERVCALEAHKKNPAVLTRRGQVWGGVITR